MYIHSWFTLYSRNQHCYCKAIILQIKINL